MRAFGLFFAFAAITAPAVLGLEPVEMVVTSGEAQEYWPGWRDQIAMATSSDGRTLGSPALVDGRWYFCAATDLAATGRP